MAYERQNAAGWAVHPGEILKEEFLKPMKISGYALAKGIGVNAQRVSDICLQKTGVSAEMAVLLAKFFGTTAEFWMNLQAAHQLVLARKTLRRKIEKVQTRIHAA